MHNLETFALIDWIAIAHIVTLLFLHVVVGDKWLQRFTITLLLLTILVGCVLLMYLVQYLLPPLFMNGFFMFIGLSYTCLAFEIVYTLNRWVGKEITLDRNEFLVNSVLLLLSIFQILLLYSSIQ